MLNMIIMCVFQEDTISINHNWLNGCNVDVVWEFLQGELSSVQKEIDEWRDTMDSWDNHCQVTERTGSPSVWLQMIVFYSEMIVLVPGDDEVMYRDRLRRIRLLPQNRR